MIGPDNSYNAAITAMVKEQMKPSKDHQQVLKGMTFYLKCITESWERRSYAAR